MQVVTVFVVRFAFVADGCSGGWSRRPRPGPRQPRYRVSWKDCEADIAEAIGSDAFEAARAEGAGWDFDRTVAYATGG